MPAKLEVVLDCRQQADALIEQGLEPISGIVLRNAVLVSCELDEREITEVVMFRAMWRDFFSAK